MRVEVLTGAALDVALEDVAALRIAVFRDWPYLYDGDLDYERAYLDTYRKSKDAILVGAFDGARLVGASTGTPMADHADDFGAAFAKADIPLSDVFYCAESVLLPQYRGHGIGHRFFDTREAHARHLGARYSAFCSVVRPDDHPLKPEQYQSLHGFWRKRWYTPLDGAVAQFRWKDVDQTEETAKPLQVWMRHLEKDPA
ncbi:GNAT family N-acetyltransferase [Marivita sp. S6314]|uniref:GNAT family N-acetyltransferase n=1 Tax=Marivita sp. S6314 TaxID=2926406 RepID=UPI001FF30709|nr:GNAT family N-acetyltransferase [Marivita sp. S6314]MCK0149062.1 GNAT family N-acetyltransferase [Marivita sp. S6314]